jgi:hypothetical protein
MNPKKTYQYVKDISWKSSCSNFLENHWLGVTWSQSGVFGDMGNFKIRKFLKLGLDWVWLWCARVCAPEHPGVLDVPGCTAGLGCIVTPGFTQVWMSAPRFTWMQTSALPGVLWCTSHTALLTTKRKISEHHNKFQLVHALVCFCACRCAQVCLVGFGGLWCTLVHSGVLFYSGAGMHPGALFYSGAVHSSPWVCSGSFVHDLGSLRCACPVRRSIFSPFCKTSN